MDHDLLHRRDDFARDNQLRRQLDEAQPSLAGAIVLAVILAILVAVYLGSPASNPTSVATWDTIETPVPVPTTP